MTENFSMQLHNKTQQYIKKSEYNTKQLYDIIKLHDISSSNIIPNRKIFINNQANQEMTQLKKHDKTKSNKLKCIKTNELFYYNGIISSSFFTERKLCKTKQNEYEFAQVLCNKNWLLVQTIFCQFSHKKIFNPKNIDIIHIGDNDGGIVSGIYYYLNFSNFAKSTGLNHVSSVVKNINWLCMGKNLNNSNDDFNRFKLYYNAISREHDISKHIIRGFANDDICNYSNYKFAKTQIFDNITPSIIFNTLSDINAEVQNIYKPILISLSLATYAKEHTLVITKLLQPTYWDSQYEKYIMLISNMFNEAYIISYPACENNMVYYEYYVISYGIPKLMYLDKLRKRFEYVNSSNSNLFDISDDMIDDDILQKIKKIKTERKKSPLSQLHELIYNLKDII